MFVRENLISADGGHFDSLNFVDDLDKFSRNARLPDFRDTCTVATSLAGSYYLNFNEAISQDGRRYRNFKMYKNYKFTSLFGASRILT